MPTRNPALDQPLIDAAWANDVDRARALIAAGADVNAQDDTQQSAYLIATSEGYLDLLELTLANGADLTSLDSYRGTGLIRAAERGHADIVGRLLRAGHRGQPRQPAGLDGAGRGHRLRRRRPDRTSTPCGRWWPAAPTCNGSPVTAGRRSSTPGRRARRHRCTLQAAIDAAPTDPAAAPPRCCRRPPR